VQPEQVLTIQQLLQVEKVRIHHSQEVVLLFLLVEVEEELDTTKHLMQLEITEVQVEVNPITILQMV
jgi:hypothetical protein